MLNIFVFTFLFSLMYLRQQDVKINYSAHRVFIVIKEHATLGNGVAHCFLNDLWTTMELCDAEGYKK